ncbi:MAG: flavodoxin [Dehalococcoidia bacterium]|nr:flavodoxin [Dehalococcoidia bacterium]
MAEAIASAIRCRVLQPSSEASESARASRLVGLGSGIFFGSHHKQLIEFGRSLPEGHGVRAFLFSTSGTGLHLPRLLGRDYHRTLRAILADKGYSIVGEFSCRGYDTYGPWAPFGGIARGHPTEADLISAGQFASNLTLVPGSSS